MDRNGLQFFRVIWLIFFFGQTTLSSRSEIYQNNTFLKFLKPKYPIGKASNFSRENSNIQSATLFPIPYTSKKIYLLHFDIF